MSVVSIDPEHSGYGSFCEQPAPQYAVFPRRYWLLFLMSYQACLQNMVWVTFSSTVKEAKALYDTSDATIDWVTAWGAYGYVVMAPVTPWVVRKCGVRGSATVGAALIVFCCLARLVRNVPILHIAQFVNAMAGPLTFATCPKLSAEWFAPHHRTIATSTVQMASYSGTGVAFILALPVNSQPTLLNLMYLEAIAAGLLLVLMIGDHVLFR